MEKFVSGDGKSCHVCKKKFDKTEHVLVHATTAHNAVNNACSAQKTKPSKSQLFFFAAYSSRQ